MRDDKSRGTPTALCASACFCEERGVGLNKHPEYYFYTKTQIGKWTQIEENFDQIDTEFRKKISQTLKNTTVRKQLQHIESGCISATSVFSRLYHVQSLEHLFTTNGFEVLSTFIVDAYGHIIHDFSKRWEQGQRIGIVVSKKCSA